MTGSTLLILGGGVLASVLAALIFTPRRAGENEQTREMRKLMTALEGQRRIRDAQQAREQRQLGAVRRPPATGLQAPNRVADAPPAPAPAPVPETNAKRNDRRSAEHEHKAVLAAEQAERRVAEQQRKRVEKEQAAARQAELDAEKRARRQAEQERKAALALEQAERRAAEQQRKREERERAAARKAERDAEAQAAAAAEHHWPDLQEPEVPREAKLDAERTGVPPAEEQLEAEIAAGPLTPSALRDLDEIARWRAEDDRKAAAKAARTKRRVSERVYKRQEDAVAAAQQSEREAEEHARRVEEERRAALQAEEARRATERERAKEAMERAAALESKRKADAEALRRAEDERNEALEAERAERATPGPWTADTDHMAALNAERNALEVKQQELRVADEREAQQAPDALDERSHEKPSRLADLPLYSWAHANEDEDEAPAEPD
jgi:hypothetical protein